MVTLAITGVGIPHTSFGFAGFFSKDAIIESTFAAGMTGNVAAQFAFWIALIAATLTSFYSWRLAFMTFHGTYKGDAHGHGHHDDHAHTDDAHAHAVHAASGGHDQHAHSDATSDGVAPAHESPLVMLIPLVLLAFGALFAGTIFYEAFVGHHSKEFWGSAIYNAPGVDLMKAKYDVPGWVFYAPFVCDGHWPCRRAVFLLLQ